MNLAGWRFLIFAITGAALIVLLASIGTPSLKHKAETIDRHTGRRVLRVRTVAEALYAARHSGNALHARARFAAERRKFKDKSVLDALDAVLAAELSNDLAPPHALHPESAIILAEQERARRLRAQIDEMLEKKLDRATLLALLDDLEADATIAASTEDFFAPLARWNPDRDSEIHRPDEWAARRIDSLDTATEPPSEADFLEIVDAFRSQNRLRARRRWLLRGFGAVPRSEAIRERLIRAYLEHGWTKVAFLVVGTALRERPKDMELWNYRAQIAGWLSRPKLEVEARIALLAETDNTEARERIITLCRYIGDPAAAIPHAIVVAKTTKNPALRERPSRLALESGQIDLALRLLTEEAERTHDHKFWREKIIAYARQDLRVDRVIKELKFLRAKYPKEDYDARLESVYRRRNMTRELVELLDARLVGSEDAELEREVIALHASLGNMKRVKVLLLRRVDRIKDPARFFSDLGNFHALKIDVRDSARRLIRSDAFGREHVEPAIDALRALFDVPGYRKLAFEAARRWPNEPISREYLILAIDAEPDDAARAVAAAKLSREFPEDRAYLRAWIERAGWAGDPAAEAEARARWLELQPDDHDNERKLGNLYIALERPADALKILERFATREGPDSDAYVTWINALFAAGRLEEAVAALEKRAARPNASIDDRLRAAEQLFSQSFFDRSLHFYTAILDHEKEHPLALLRIGQIRSWTNDPRGAIPFFEQRLALTDELAPEVRYYLGEAHWAIRENDAGRRYHTLGLEDLLPQADRSIEQDVMVAKMLARLGRIDEAIPLFEKTIEALPDNVNLVLDFADSMMAVGRLERARELVDRAKLRAPRKARVMRIDGSLLLREQRPEEAAAILELALERHGPEAGTESERGLAYEWSGDYIAATDAYERSLQLQPGNVDVTRALQTLADQLATYLHAEMAFRRVGDDSVFSLRAIGSKQLGERWRGAAELGVRRYEGTSSAGEVEDTVFFLNVAGFYRHERANTLSFGLSAFPGADGDVPAGAWVSWHRVQREPFGSLHATAYANLLFDDPAAAVSFGGRRSGISIDYNRDLGKRAWGSAAVTLDAISLDDVGADDTRIDALISLGWRFRDGTTRIAPPMSLSRASLPGLAGMRLSEDPEHTAGPLFAAWVSLQAIRYLDNELAAFLPVGEEFFYLSVGGRADVHFARGWGAAAELSLGSELQAGDFFFNARGGVTWRPSHRVELTATVGLGTAQGRDSDSTSAEGRIGLTVRW